MDKKCIEMRRFILTGTPGSGKTSVIRELETLGHAVIHEAATDVIAQEQAKGIEKPCSSQLTLWRRVERWITPLPKLKVKNTSSSN